MSFCYSFNILCQKEGEKMYIPEIWIGVIIGVIVGVSFTLGLGAYANWKESRGKDK